MMEQEGKHEQEHELACEQEQANSMKSMTCKILQNTFGKILFGN